MYISIYNSESKLRSSFSMHDKSTDLTKINQIPWLLGVGQMGAVNFG